MLDEEFRAIFLREFTFVSNSLRRLGVQDRDLEDVVVEVLLQFRDRYDAYDKTRPLRPWLFALAVHAASDYRRLARHREVVNEVGSGFEEADGAPSAEAQLIERENRAMVIEALDGIPLDRRAVFIMHDIDEVPVPEIAAALAIPLNTAYSRLRLARVDFEQAMTRLLARRGER